MADECDEHAAERKRIREHHRAILARVAAIRPETRDAELRVVRELVRPEKVGPDLGASQ